MKCPIDESTLVMTERTGIEIDYCPTCRGVWLDRGELDKIIDRSLTAATPEPAQQPKFSTGGGRESKHGDGGHGSREGGSHGSNNGYGNPPRRREGWLSNLFD